MGVNKVMTDGETVKGTWIDESGLPNNYIRIYLEPIYNTASDGRQVRLGSQSRSVWFKQPEFMPQEKIEGGWSQGSIYPNYLTDVVYDFVPDKSNDSLASIQMRIDVVNRDRIIVHGSVMANGSHGLHEVSKFQRILRRIAEAKSST
jgi:hypothetical protein